MINQTTSLNARDFKELERVNAHALKELEQEDRGWYRTPKVLQRVRRELNLKPVDINVLSVFWTCAYPEHPRHPTITEISDCYGYDERTIRSSYKRLLKEGLLIPIDCEGRGKKTYLINADRVREVYEQAITKEERSKEEDEARKRDISIKRSRAGRKGGNARWHGTPLAEDENSVASSGELGRVDSSNVSFSNALGRTSMTEEEFKAEKKRYAEVDGVEAFGEPVPLEMVNQYIEEARRAAQRGKAETEADGRKNGWGRGPDHSDGLGGDVVPSHLVEVAHPDALDCHHALRPSPPNPQ